MNLESIEVDSVEAVFLENGAYSVTLTDAGNNPVLEPAPGETPLWNETRVTGLFDADADLKALERDLLQTLGLDELPPNSIDNLADRVWEREWLKDFGPMKFGRRLWIVPGVNDFSVADAVVVRLDPGLAFGTGTHATTALCLQWLDGIDVAGRTLLDFGCGSGILSVAACKLGAKSVVGVDIDLQAVSATRQNAERNNVAEQLSVGNTVRDGPEQFDFVVANILADTLIENATQLCGLLKSGGMLALSGVLRAQIEQVQRPYRELVEFEPPAIQDNWARLTGTKR
jgi:ribosomal protein L11 methyltransferase